MARRTGAHQHQGKLHEASPDSSRFSQFKSLDRMHPNDRRCFWSTLEFDTEQDVWPVPVNQFDNSKRNHPFLRTVGGNKGISSLFNMFSFSLRAILPTSSISISFIIPATVTMIL